MRTVTQSYLLAALLLGGTGLTGCATDEADAPAPADPTPEFALARYVAFAAAAPGGGTSSSGYGQRHPSQDIAGTARLDATGKVLVLTFKAAPDEVYFELDQNQLRPGWTGTYHLRCQARPTDPVFISYLYTNAGLGNTAILRLSDWSRDLTGDVTITAYDARRHLISGSYTITAPNQRDPSVPANTSSQVCTISLAGDFTNLKVQY